MSDTERYRDGMRAPDEPRSHSERTTEHIEREIERTRERMSRDIDELGERLSPRNLKEEAKEAISERAREMAENVTAQARSTGHRVLNFVQENPSLVGAMGAGAVWLVRKRNRSPVSAGAAHRNPLVVAAGAAIVGLAVGLVAQSAGERRITGAAREG